MSSGFIFRETVEPEAPTAEYVHVYAKPDSVLYYKASDGVQKTFGNALISNPLSQFAATTIAQLNALLSDGVIATGGGTATGENTGDQTDISGNAATVTTIPNLTGHIVSSGNATVLGAFTIEQLNAALSNADLLPTTNPVVLGIAVSNETTDLVTEIGLGEFQIVHGAFTLLAIYATVTGAPTGSTAIIDVNLNGTTLMETDKISIDVAEKTSDTAAIPPVLTTTALPKNGIIGVDVDQIGSGDAGTGLKIYLVGHWT